MREEAAPEGAVDRIEERMPEWVARGRWESFRPNIQGFQSKADLLWVSPVSYTHLDVYKRQVSGGDSIPFSHKKYSFFDLF